MAESTVERQGRPAGSTAPEGLTTAEVEARIRDGRVNAVPSTPSRTFGQIVRANVFTPVNGIIGTLLVLILVSRPGADALFAGVVVSNSIIGIAQEVRAKRALDRLAVLNAPRARVVRDGEVTEIAVHEVVADEVLDLHPGDQVVVDGEVLHTQGLEINESLLTGESDPVAKGVDDEVMSGSFVAAGSGRYRATRIGADSYAASLAEQARRFVLVHSELRSGVNTVLRWLTWIIPPAALLLLWRLLRTEEEWREAMRGTVAAAVAMVPDGLVLLTSIAFIVGILALARNHALAKELASVELLARVDVLCLDKTGTITTGEITFAEVVPLDGADPGQVAEALGAMAAADENPNATLAAIAEHHGAPDGWVASTVVPFSSARKYSAVEFAAQGTWILGAPEVVLGDDGAGGDGRAVRDAVGDAARVGRRMLLLARGADGLADGELPARREPVALVALEDQVRPDAPDILRYFHAQGLTLKVISGDHPETVAAVARRAGVPGVDGPDDAVDARELPVEAGALADVVERTAVFGRVNPHQKQAMVGALQARGHVVAMTGDGVNDVLALKDADMGIAMGAGSAASRSVAQLVLLDNRFATLPIVLAEGRRVINNIERVANLFIVKAAYAVLLTVLTVLAGVEFPFLPRHLTLIGTFSIGVPGFFLAMAPNARRALPGFLGRVLRFSLPSGAVAGIVTFGAYEIVRRSEDHDLTEARTAATLVLLGIVLVILARLSRPLTPWRVGLVVAMGVSYVVVLLVPALREFFVLEVPGGWTWGVVAAAVALATVVLVAGPRLIGWWGEGDRAMSLPPAEDGVPPGSSALARLFRRGADAVTSSR